MRKSNVISNLINAAIFILLEIAALTMLNNSGILQNTWFSKGIHKVNAFFWGSTQNLQNYFSLKKVNEALANDNHEIRVRLAELEAIINDSLVFSRMKSNQGIANGYKYLPAEIVKISNNTQHNYIIIDKGSSDGIVNGSGIITGHGVVGVIDAVGKNFSYARSFKNREMNISTRLGREGAVGQMSWEGISSNMAILREIPHHVDFQPGDTVFTSGFSSIFPPDIPLGTTGEAKIVNGATYEIKIRLFEDFSALRYVSVVEKLGKGEIKDMEDAI